jgi:hypothetical protein
MNEQTIPPGLIKQQRKQARLGQLLNELTMLQLGTPTRQDIIRRIEEREPSKPRRLLIYIANVANQNSQINAGHTVAIGDALVDMRKEDNLDLMIHTMGGSGETAEKIVEMCRNHCSGEFRVIIPNMAKSAGTLIALGADKIVMGHCSEVGPIDPQIRMNIGNTPQMVSAWTFIHTRDDLANKVDKAIAKGESADALLLQLANVDSVFVKHCEQLMEFAKQIGVKWIAKRLMAKSTLKPEEAEAQAGKVIAFLSNVEELIIHGRLILARELKDNCEPPLEIVNLEESDETWQFIWELYLRCEFYLMMPNPPGMPPKAVLIETSKVSFTLNA